MDTKTVSVKKVVKIAKTDAIKIALHRKIGQIIKRFEDKLKAYKTSMVETYGSNVELIYKGELGEQKLLSISEESNNRLDTVALKLEHPAIYQEFTKTGETKIVVRFH